MWLSPADTLGESGIVAVHLMAPSGIVRIRQWRLDGSRMGKGGDVSWKQISVQGFLEYEQLTVFIELKSINQLSAVSKVIA